jgi:hypothetical protein
MDNKTKPLDVYIATNMRNARSEKDYSTKEEAKNNHQWGEESTIKELLHIVKIDQHPRFNDLPIYMSQNV